MAIGILLRGDRGYRPGSLNITLRSQRFYSSSGGGSYQRSDSPMIRGYQRSATPQLQERRSLRGVGPSQPGRRPCCDVLQLPTSTGMGSLMGSNGAPATSSLRQNYMGSSSLRSSQQGSGWQFECWVEWPFRVHWYGRCCIIRRTGRAGS